jgi:hypothetical protein
MPREWLPRPLSIASSIGNEHAAPAERRRGMDEGLRPRW